MVKRYWDEMNFPQPTDRELKENAKATAKKAAKKGKELHPVVITGCQITKSWWGNAWCSNLERYADFDNRLPRGKRYVKTGAVIDLEITKGKILARVQGTRKTPYKVEIRISPLSEQQIPCAVGGTSRSSDRMSANSILNITPEPWRSGSPISAGHSMTPTSRPSYVCAAATAPCTWWKGCP